MSKKIKTVAYKGSKRKLLDNILKLTKEINAQTFFDGFSGSGIVCAYMRSKGYKVYSNDLNPSSFIFGSVFLNGFDYEIVQKHIENINNITPNNGWLTNNYCGQRFFKGQNRPSAFSIENGMKLDAARDYVENLQISENNKNAIIFSIIAAADSVINNTSDQKSSFKNWLEKSKKPVVFSCPTLINGPIGHQTICDVFSVPVRSYDVVYLDPPYSNGVLYSSCYHISDSIVLWDKPKLDYNYALPRPMRAIFRNKNKKAGKFYSKKTVEKDFNDLLKIFSESKRIILSYSDAPRNLISIDKLERICNTYGTCNLYNVDHKLCTQFASQKKVSNSLKEYFLVVDTF